MSITYDQKEVEEIRQSVAKHHYARGVEEGKKEVFRDILCFIVCVIIVLIIIAII